MPEITLTEFIDIVAASGSAKYNAVKKAKKLRMGGYDPQFDFWKPMRECIVGTHTNGLSKANISSLHQGMSDKNKLSTYPDVENGYVKWWGQKQITTFPAPKEKFSAHGVDVTVNPEYAIKINGGTRHVVKLYFKSDALSKAKVDIILYLMEASLRGKPKCQTADVMAVMDVRRSKMFTPTIVIPGIAHMLDAELAYVAALWPNV